MFRDKNSNNVSKFKDELQMMNWSEVRESSDQSSVHDIFLRKYTDIYNNCFPLKRVKIKHYDLTKPWISKALLKSIKKKNILYRRFLSNPTSTREISYKNYKNKLSSTLRVAKRNYFDKKFEECKSNMKSTWRLLNEVINKRKTRNSVQSSFIIDNKEITDPLACRLQCFSSVYEECLMSLSDGVVIPKIHCPPKKNQRYGSKIWETFLSLDQF